MNQTITAQRSRSTANAVLATDQKSWFSRLLYWGVRSIFGVCLVFSLPALAEPVAPGSVDEISVRIAPFGTLCRAGEGCGNASASAATGAMNGNQVYDKFCMVCHAAGIGGAPKLGDTAAWAERTAKGMDALWTSTLNGVNAMPPKGTCMGCSDEELQAAIDYMVPK